MPVHSQVYFRHIDRSLMRKLNDLFHLHNNDSKKFRQLAKRIHSSQGHVYAQKFLSKIQPLHLSLGIQCLEQHDGLSILNLTNTDIDEPALHYLMTFLKQLVPDLHLQAWCNQPIQGIESWMKYDALQLVVQHNSTATTESLANPQIQQIYQWWHADLPTDIQVGHLQPTRLAI
jgi:hypothetical protein